MFVKIIIKIFVSITVFFLGGLVGNSLLGDLEPKEDIITDYYTKDNHQKKTKYN